MTKLWDKGTKVEKLIESFTIGKDNELDLLLAGFDVLGTIAHIRMLHSIGLLNALELKKLEYELISIYKQIQDGQFKIEEGIEDVHSQVELMLTKSLGAIGKKVHTGRSRNDQVLLDIKLFIRHEIKEIVALSQNLFDTFIELSEKYKHVLIPGYTHSQIAMPSSFGLWFGAYAESLTDDMQLLLSAYRLCNQNPLGSGAGYGSSFPLNRTMTTELLGFDTLNYNVVNAQMGRGKVEKTVSFALASIGATLSKMSMDICLYVGQNFGFMSFPEEFTTGSSIMPHKKNPDVFEILRAKGNKLQSLVYELSLITTNLPSGYHRDLQITKENFMPAFEDLKLSITITRYILENVIINENILDDEKYSFLFSVEEVNKMVLEGIPFRDAYKMVAKRINDGTYRADKNIHHTHEGSIGNLCNDEIKQKMTNTINEFNFGKVEEAYKSLLQDAQM